MAAVLIALVAVIAGRRRRKPAAAPGSERPNVVVIMTDDQDFRSMGGDAEDAAADRRNAGRTFTQTIVNFPLCCPSRATFLTGQYAHNHGVAVEQLPRRAATTSSTARETLPVWLRRAGYRTIHIGKYLNEYGERRPDARSRRAGTTGTAASTRRPTTTTATRSTTTAS